MKVHSLILAWRGVQVDARRRTTYVLRIALVASLLIGLSFVTGQAVLFGAPGLHFLSTMHAIDVLAIAAMACTVFATTITEEKELQTLGLLRLAGYGRVSILLGKSVRELVAVLGLLIVQLPFVLLSVALGGVSTAHVLGLFAVLASFTMFAGALGVCASTVFSSGRAASAVTCFVLFLYSVLPAWIPAVTGWGPMLSVASWLREVSVWTAFRRLAGDPEGLVWPVVVGHLALAAAFFALAWIAFERRNAADRPAAPARAFGLGRRGTARVQGAAVVWKDTRFMVGGRFGVLMRFVAYGVIVLFFVGFWSGGSSLTVENVGMLMLMVGMLGGAVDACLYAGRMFREEIQWHTLPLLLAVPTSSVRVVAQKFVPVLWVLFPAACCALLGAMLAPRRAGQMLDEPWAVGYILSVFTVTFVLTLHLSLRLRRGAFALALGLVILAHMAFGIFASILMSRGGQALELCAVSALFLAAGLALVTLVGLEDRVRRIGGRQ